MRLRAAQPLICDLPASDTFLLTVQSVKAWRPMPNGNELTTDLQAVADAIKVGTAVPSEFQHEDRSRRGIQEELARLADASDFRGLAALLAPSGQELPDPDRLYRGLGLDDADLGALLTNLGTGRGVPSREPYLPEKLADLAVTESLARGVDSVRTLFKDRTPRVEAALRRLESAILDIKCLFRAEVALRLTAEPGVESRLLERCAKSYFLGECQLYMQSAVLGGTNGLGSGSALYMAVKKGLTQGKHLVVVEFDRPSSGIVEAGVYPNGIHELVILGDIPGPAVRAVWIDGQRFTPQELAQWRVGGIDDEECTAPATAGNSLENVT